MKIGVLGGDGYCGWATALYLSSRGHSVSIVDNFARRQWDYELGVQTLTPIRPLSERLKVWQQLTGHVVSEAVPVPPTAFQYFVQWQGNLASVAQFEEENIAIKTDAACFNFFFD